MPGQNQYTKSNRPWTNKEKMLELCKKNLTQKEMAEKLDCSQDTISRWLDNHGIEHSMLNLTGGRNKYATFQMKNGGNYERWVNWDSEEGKQYVYHHRLLAVLKFGFDEISNKIIHHKNSIPWDNRIENLEVMGQSEHISIRHDNGDMQ